MICDTLTWVDSLHKLRTPPRMMLPKTNNQQQKLKRKFSSFLPIITNPVCAVDGLVKNGRGRYKVTVRSTHLRAVPTFTGTW